MGIGKPTRRRREERSLNKFDDVDITRIISKNYQKEELNALDDLTVASSRWSCEANKFALNSQ
jgi:hypothetical protein